MPPAEERIADGVTEEGRSPLEFLRILRERLLLVVLVAVVCVIVADAISLSSERKFTSTAQVVFRDPAFARALFGAAPFESQAEPERSSSTNIAILESRTIAGRVQDGARLPRGTDLEDVVEITAEENSDLASIEVETTSPALSARIANAYATEYIAYRREADREKVREAQRFVEQSLRTASQGEQRRLRTSLKQLKVLEALQTGNAEQVVTAEPAQEPSSPKPVQTGLLAAAVGLVLGAALALLADAVDRRLKRTEDMERAFGHPVIAGIPRGAVADRKTGSLTGANAEPYRILREALRFLEVARAHRCVLVTSPGEGEGKTTVAVNLARALVAGGQRVILIEADLRRPYAAVQLVDGSLGLGLSGALVSRSPLAEQLVGTSDPSLKVLPAGPLPPNPADLFRTADLSELLREAKSLADTVILDTPPLLPVSDTQVLLDLEEVDGVLVVARLFFTRRDRAREAHRVLERSGRPVLGVVSTFAPRDGGYYYGEPMPTGDSLRSSDGRSAAGSIPSGSRSGGG